MAHGRVDRKWLHGDVAGHAKQQKERKITLLQTPEKRSLARHIAEILKLLLKGRNVYVIGGGDRMRPGAVTRATTHAIVDVLDR